MYPIIISIKSTQLNINEKKNISKFCPFGVILFSRNISSFNQLNTLIKSIKSINKKINILIDQEGGMVNRFNSFPELKFSDNYDYYKIFLKHPSLAKQLVYLKSFITSFYLARSGININTVPVLDIPNNNTVKMIKKRTFGSNTTINQILNNILVNTSIKFGVMPVMKHIPGHGLTNKDSHFYLPVSKASKSTLNKQIFLFKKFNKLPMSMTAHLKYLNWDNKNIASYSPKIIKNLIRKKIKFKGLIMTDDLTMKANIYDIEQSVYQSNISGVDIILDCSSDWKRYEVIIKNFNKTKYFKNRDQILFKYVNKKHYLKSININHYHDLYNELINLYGI